MQQKQCQREIYSFECIYQKDLKVYDLTYLSKLERKNKLNPKYTEIIKIRLLINKIENRKFQRKSRKPKAGSLKSKSSKPLPMLTEKKKNGTNY